MRQRALFTGRCIAPTLGGASGVQLSCFPISHITIHITPSDSSPLGLIYQPACGAQRCGEGRAAASFVHRSLHRPHIGRSKRCPAQLFSNIPHHNPHHTQRQLTIRVDLPTRLWRTEVWRKSCGSELCSPVAASPPHWAEQTVSSSAVFQYPTSQSTSHPATAHH